MTVYDLTRGGTIVKFKGSKGSGKGPTISFKEATVKYGWSWQKLQAMLKREGAPAPVILSKGSNGAARNTYYNKQEFTKWVSSLPPEEVPNGR